MGLKAMIFIAWSGCMWMFGPRLMTFAYELAKR